MGNYIVIIITKMGSFNELIFALYFIVFSKCCNTVSITIIFTMLLYFI